MSPTKEKCLSVCGCLCQRLCFGLPSLLVEGDFGFEGCCWESCVEVYMEWDTSSRNEIRLLSPLLGLVRDAKIFKEWFM